jgi:SAM-dependent methyltransferase
MTATSKDLQARTIADFGEQWTSYPDTGGFFGSAELFNDFFNPLVKVADVVGCRVAEIGAGTGRFVNVLAAAGARHIIAVEPSAAFRVLRDKTRSYADRVTYLEVPGDQLPPSGDLDYVFAIGVLHHIPDPEPVVAAPVRGRSRGGPRAGWGYGGVGQGRPARRVALRA